MARRRKSTMGHKVRLGDFIYAGKGDADRYLELYKYGVVHKQDSGNRALILRRWEESDAEDLYKYASDPDATLTAEPS